MIGLPYQCDHGTLEPAVPGGHDEPAEVLPPGAVALEVLHVRQGHLHDRPPIAVRSDPLVAPARLRHRVAVVAPPRVVQRSVHDDGVRRSAGDRLDRFDHRAADLADALETAEPARLRLELVHEPVGGDRVDAVDDGAPASRREQRARREAVDLIDAETGISHRLEHRPQSEWAQLQLVMAHDRAVGVANDGDLARTGETRRHHAPPAGRKNGIPASKSASSGSPMRKLSGSTSSTRARIRTSGCSTSSTSPTT